MPDIKLIVRVMAELLVASTSPPLHNQDKRQFLVFCRDRVETREFRFGIAVHVLMHGFHSQFGDRFFPGHHKMPIGLVKIEDQMRGVLMIRSGQLTKEMHAFSIIDCGFSCGSRPSETEPDSIREAGQKMPGTLEIEK
jgi:hypothetical protein